MSTTAAEPKPKPRRHHYLPISYLRNFCTDDERLYVYERGKLPRKSSPQNEACIRDFYAYEANHAKHFDFEHLLSQHESQVAPVIRGILERERTKERRLLTKEETAALNLFVGFTFTRGPAGRRLSQDHTGPATRAVLEEIAQNHDRFHEVIRETDCNSDIPEDELSDVIEDARLQIIGGFFAGPDPPDYELQAMVHIGEMIAKELSKSNLQIVIAPKHEDFITGDMPIITGKPEGTGFQLGTSFGSEENEVWLPVNNKVCLRWSRRIEPGYARLRLPVGVRMVNRNVMRFSERFVYSNSYSLKLANVFTRMKQEIVFGENSFIPMWGGKPIKYK